MMIAHSYLLIPLTGGTSVTLDTEGEGAAVPPQPVSLSEGKRGG